MSAVLLPLVCIDVVEDEPKPVEEGCVAFTLWTPALVLLVGRQGWWRVEGGIEKRRREGKKEGKKD